MRMPAKSDSLLLQHVALVVVSTAAAVALAVPLGILAAKRPQVGAPHRRHRQPGPDNPQSRALRLPAAAPARRRHRAAGRDRRAGALRGPAHPPHHRRGVPGDRSGRAGSGAGHGHAAARAAAARGAASGLAVDARGHPRRDGDRRRHGDDRGGDRRRRARRVHLPRPVDGGCDRHSRRRRSVRGARARRRRRSGAAAAAHARTATATARPRDGRGDRRHAAGGICRRALLAEARTPSWWARRTSPSRSSSAS